MNVLQELRTGRRDSLDRPMPVVYERLRVMARRQLKLFSAKPEAPVTDIGYLAAGVLPMPGGAWAT